MKCYCDNQIREDWRGVSLLVVGMEETKNAYSTSVGKKEDIVNIIFCIEF